MLHTWSKEAVTAFWKAAQSLGSRRMDIRKGLDFAFLVDAPLLAPIFAGLWVEALTDEAIEPMFFKVTQGDNVVTIPVDRKFLFTVLKLTPGDFQNGQDSTRPDEGSEGVVPLRGDTDGPTLHLVSEDAE